MKYKSYIPLLLLTILLINSSCSATTKHSKPNIIFILIDDLGWTAPTCYGDK